MGERDVDYDSTQAIAYRTNLGNRERLEQLRYVMTPSTWRALHEWLFDQPEVQAVIAAKIRGER